jgi:XTP/dITP diphosphohydrolase
VTISHKVVLASANPHKLEELRSALPGWEVEALARDDYPAETGSSYRENAAAKAGFGRRHASTEAWVVGEDSGIEVAALAGGPGIESSRWAADGVASMLAALAGETDRRARYVCVMVAVAADGAELVAQGVLEGSIATGPPRGLEGFGYDPIFVPAGETRTVAELGDTWKRARSHRAQAAAALAQAFDHH